MTECEEVARVLLPHVPEGLVTHSEVHVWVREQMPDENYIVTSNVAEAIQRMTAWGM